MTKKNYKVSHSRDLSPRYEHFSEYGNNDRRFSFGKYVGLLYSEVEFEDPQYLKWCIKKGIINYQMKLTEKEVSIVKKLNRKIKTKIKYKKNNKK